MHIPGYQIERQLGQGGMAIVYLALQESLHRRVALKVIKPVLTTDEEFAQRFMREGRIIAQLSDPYIVTVYDIASYEGTYYLSMEYLPGDTLQHRIRNGLPLDESLAIARAIASALHYAHHRGIIHRDIKPQNILFRENGCPVLTDFGIAKTLGGSTIMTRTGLSLGTPRYMSPEQIRGQAVDARSDLYSFGVLFYEMLTGNAPYTAEDSFALAMMHVTAPVPELPPRLHRFQPIINKLLDKDPSRRFQTGQEFIATLDRPETLPIAPLDIADLTRPTPIPIASAGRSPRRFGWKIGALAATLAGLTLAGGGYLYWSQEPPKPIPSVVVTPPGAPPTVDVTAQRRVEADQLLVQARQRQQEGVLEESRALIEQASRLAPNHPDLPVLREAVNRQLEAARTRQAEEEQRLQAELRAEQFLEQAQRARQEGALELSLARIEEGLRAMPGHPALLALGRDVREQQAKRLAQEATARQEEQRKAEQTARLRAEAEQHRAQADEFLARALDAQRDRAYETSLLHIEQGLQQVPDHSRLLALRDQVRKQLREAKALPPPVQPPTEPVDRIAVRLRECAAHLQANRLTSGKGGNAADCYGDVLQRDPGNAEARAGMERIADHYADLAAEAVRRGDVKAARSSLDRLERLNRSDHRLAGLREQLAQAQKPVSPPPPRATESEQEPEPPRPRVAQAEPPPKPEPKSEVGPPPINLVSVPQPAESAPAPRAIAPEPETQVIAQDRYTRLSRTETKEGVSLQITTAPQGILEERPPTSGTTTAPRTAEQAWAAIRNSNDPAEIQQFLTSYPKSRQASAAQAKLKQLQTQPGVPARLFVRADQAEAEVLINGRNVGTTPLEVELKPGSYKVRVHLEGHADWNGQVNLSAGDESTLSATLAPKRTEVAAVKPTARPPEPKPEPEPEPEPSRPRAAETQPTQGAPSTAPGCLRGNCQNGEGAYRHPDGEYSGEFRNAKMHGQGTYVYASRGEKYVGEWRNNVINGQGTYYYRSGNRYEGEWRNGRKEGQGTYLYANGDKYVGDFASDQPNGQGIYYYRNGDRYEGEWRNGRKEGRGVLYENGQRIVGEWQDDRKVRVTVEK
ncbi:MAG: protein kinase [Candidatus Contendobacter sp.]|nr:protein kinase [Candidatus Contendobacter sp.]MDS4057105.1 protein kinase [Candidatus Contendobacter sp.]